LAAVKILLQNKSDSLTILPTGGGKTVVYSLCAFIENYRFLPEEKFSPTRSITVLVLPLVILKADQFARLQQCNSLHVRCWDKQNLTTDEFGNLIHGHGNLDIADIVIVATETFVTGIFKSWMTIMKTKGLLQRVVFDEAHLVMDQNDFRVAMSQLPCIRSTPLLANLRFHLFTATIAPHKEDKLKTLFNINFYQSSTVRSLRTDRPNLIYETRKVQSKQEAYISVTELVETMKGRRQIIFCPTLNDMDTIVTLLQTKQVNALKYFGGMIREDKIRIWESFISSDVNGSNVLVGTIAAGLGADCSDIGQVIVFGACAGWEWWAQMGGRAGRDGCVAKVVLVYAEETIAEQRRREQHEEKLSEFNFFMSAAQNTAQCMRSALVGYVDGAQVDSCLGSDGSYQHCSHCTNLLQATRLSDIKPSPLSSSSNVVTVTNNKLIEKINLVVADIEYFLKVEIGRAESFCPVCFLVMKTFQHKACNYNRCLFCLNIGHFSNACPAKQVATVPIRCCYYCVLPLEVISDTKFHQGSVQKHQPDSCTSLARNVILETCLHLFGLDNSNGIRALIPTEHRNEITSYVKWLLEFADANIPLVNAVYVFAAVVKTRKDLLQAFIDLNDSL
jgi:superfamily II DNA helicase RecQ